MAIISESGRSGREGSNIGVNGLGGKKGIHEGGLRMGGGEGRQMRIREDTIYILSEQVRQDEFYDVARQKSTCVIILNVFSC